MKFDKLADLFMFREGSEADNYSDTPLVTTGSIVWGVMLRMTIVIIITFLFMSNYEWRDYWWFSFFGIWFFVAFPAFRQYQKFNDRIQNLQEEIMCGTCKHFVSNAQTCSLYDVHVSKNHIPCDGNNWEYKDWN